VPGAARNALQRWVTPWLNVERYTFAKIEPLAEQRVVPYAESFDVQAQLRSDTEWKPDKGKVILPQQEVEATLKEQGYAFKLAPQKDPQTLKLRVGDVRREVNIIPMPRPEMKTLHAFVQLPDYLQYKKPLRLEVRGGTVSVLKASQISFELQASRELMLADMDGKPATVQMDKLQTTPYLVEKSVEHRFNWQAADGLEAKEPLKLKVLMVEDAAPNVLARRDNPEQVLLENETLSLDVDASDDFGVQKVGLIWRTMKEDGSTAASGESIASAGAPEKRNLSARATFNPQRDGVKPGLVELRAWGVDYLPGRQKSVSPSFVIQVLTKDDHALWMTDMFSKWLQAARETHEQEERLHEANKELRELTEAELDRPENRRQLSQQAAAEDANQQRLEALNAAGKKLLEQAARNDQFDAQRLESMANTLRQLKEIAEKRMPTVADLLRKSADAAGSRDSGQSTAKPGQQGEQNDSHNSKNTNPQDPSKTAQQQSSKSEQAPKVAQGESSEGKPQANPPEKAPEMPKNPSLSDQEKSHFAQEIPPDKPGQPKPPGAGKLGLPSTQLGAAPGSAKPQQEQGQQPSSDSAARKELDKALAEQKKLLDAFASVSDKLRDLLASLEGSTFVKRLKSASKKQIAIAQSLNTSTLSAFGLDKSNVGTAEAKAAEEVAVRQLEQSQVVRVIQSDMEAYYQRKQDQRFKHLLKQMKDTEIVAALARVSEDTRANFSGRSITSSEYWADVLDRWAEEMVAVEEGGKGKKGSSSEDSLPPEIVLKVMQVLHDEMKLRDETREAETAKPALDKKQYFQRATRLSLMQDDIGKRTYQALTEISQLPNAKSFSKEMQLLNTVTGVMKEAYQLLDKIQTDAPVIAAETEAIELLLQSRRQPPGSGGGGGDSPGSSSSGSEVASSALQDIGPGSDSNARAEQRQVGQTTGKAGKEAPEEFKTGLDAYFNALEKPSGGEQ
jgi:hypothetical protein